MCVCGFCVQVPYSAPFDLESLDVVFTIRHNSPQARQAGTHLCPEAVLVLLAMTRELLHQVWLNFVLCVRKIRQTTQMPYNSRGSLYNYAH